MVCLSATISQLHIAPMVAPKAYLKSDICRITEVLPKYVGSIAALSAWVRTNFRCFAPFHHRWCRWFSGKEKVSFHTNKRLKPTLLGLTIIISCIQNLERAEANGDFGIDNIFRVWRPLLQERFRVPVPRLLVRMTREYFDLDILFHVAAPPSKLSTPKVEPLMSSRVFYKVARSVVRHNSKQHEAERFLHIFTAFSEAFVDHYAHQICYYSHCIEIFPPYRCYDSVDTL